MKEERFVHYRLQHTVVDAEHLDIFTQSEVVVSNLQNAENDLAMSNIEKLISTVKFHFAEEERIMTEANYLFLQRHIEAHWEILRMLTDIYAVNIPQNSSAQNIKVCKILDTLLVDHVDQYDRQFLDHKG